MTMEENSNQIITDYLNGKRIYEIANEYGYNKCTLTDFLKRKNVYFSRNKRWSDREIEHLKEYYGVIPAKELAAYFNVSIGALHSKASKLKIKNEVQRPWTDERIQMLVEYFEQGLSDAEIVERFDYRFTISAIHSKREQLNLLHRTKWTDDEISLLHTIYNKVSKDELCSLFPNRTYSQILSCARRNGLYMEGIVWSDDEANYIVDNWQTMSDKEMAMNLNRTFRSVKWKREMLGLFRNAERAVYLSLTEAVRKRNNTWKHKSREYCDNKCVLTGSTNIDVHHLHGVNLIILETLDVLGFESKEATEYSDEELDLICKTFRKIQSNYPLGVCLSKELHVLFHQIYGFGSNTIEQFEEFKNDYINNRLNHPI